MANIRIRTKPNEYISLHKKYEALANEFEGSAITLLEKCYENNSRRTEDLIIRELPDSVQSYPILRARDIGI